jgi:predicted transcriptional regulator
METAMRRKKDGERLTSIVYARVRPDMVDDLDRIAEVRRIDRSRVIREMIERELSRTVELSA